MSTIREIITRVDENKPNAFSNRQKVAWIATLDGRIAADVLLVDISELGNFCYSSQKDMDAEPLVKFPHDDIYDLWLEAQIDFANGEYDKYQNTMERYNASYGCFVRWFAHVYQPAQGGYEKRPGVPSYYVTAYGLAVKQGFRGTLDEWLASLVGPEGPAVAIRYEDEKLQWKREDEEVWKDLIIIPDVQGAADEAKEASRQAIEAREAIEGMSVLAQTLPPGSPATVEKTVESDGITFVFGIPQGKAADGFGLGAQDGRQCTDCNEAVRNGWYRLSGSGCLNVPTKITSAAYGTLFVEARMSSENKIEVYQRFAYGKYYARRQGNAATGVWEEWEYENPPMEANTEYRTTERFQSKPVYVRLIDFGALPNAGDKQVSIAVAGSLVVSMHGTVLSESGSCLEFPFIRSTLDIGATAYINAKGELHVVTSGDFRKYTAKFVIKYTKE